MCDEYKELMSGNNDDCFRIGVAVTKKGLRLYSSFEKSDIIIASPLGLRVIVGDKSEENREIGFLSSIEILIIDKVCVLLLSLFSKFIFVVQAEIILMQNWEQLLLIVNSINLTPEKITVDISRVRQWSLEQQASLYR